jgi:hypothetical protein
LDLWIWAQTQQSRHQPPLRGVASHPLRFRRSNDGGGQISVFPELGYAATALYTGTQQTPLEPFTPSEKKSDAPEEFRGDDPAIEMQLNYHKRLMAEIEFKIVAF